MSYDNFRSSLKTRASDIRRIRIEVLKRRRDAEKKIRKPGDALRSIQDQVAEILALLRKPDFTKQGKVRFDVLERDGKGKVKSFEVET